MLTEREKHGISELLHRMSTRDLTSLAQTVTSRLIIPETQGEAISAIILHTDKPDDLLKRRKVKKEFLFKYLNAKRVSVDASGDKADMIASILQLWGSNTSQSMVSGSSSNLLLPGGLITAGEEDSLPEAPAPSRNTSYSSLSSLDYGPAGSQSCNSSLSKVLGHLPLDVDALTSGLARAKSSGGCDDKSLSYSIPFPLRRSESANSFTMDDEDDAFDPIPRTTNLDMHTNSSLTTPLSCDPLRGRESLHSHPLSSSYQPSSIFSSGEQNPSFPLNGRLSQSLTPTPPPILSSSFTSTATPLAVPSSSSSSPLSGVGRPSVWNHCNSNASATTTAANLLLSSSAPSSFDPSSFFPEHTGNQNVNMHLLNSPTSPSSNNGSGQQHVNEMADTFVKWFYELINSTFYSSEHNEFGPQHFWTDASAKISLHQSPSSSSHHSSGSSSLSSTPTAISVLKETHVSELGSSETICVQENGKQVADALKHVVDKYKITYNPNMTRDGISGLVDAHGLALITACGTLHNTVTSVVCGTFQQQFGLIRDPNLGNNWKIKFTYANLVSKESVSQQPTLAQHHHLLQQHPSPFSSQYQQMQPQNSFLNFNMTSSDASTPFASSGESGASSSASSTSDAFPSSSSAMAIS